MVAKVFRQMLDHRFTQAHASDYLDGELSETGRRRVERHASVCPRCQELIASLRRMLGTLSGLGGTPRPGVSERAIERLRRES